MLRIKSWITCWILLLGMTTFSGCNTAEGFGEDMEEAGEAIQEEAND